MDPREGNKSARGFAGLSDLIPEQPAEVPESVVAPAPPPPIEPHRPTSDHRRSESPSDPEPVVPSAPDGSVPWGWIAAGAIGLIIVIANINSKSASSGVGTTASYASRSQEPAPSAPIESLPIRPEESVSAWTETPPPPAQDRVLTYDELRYCRSEKVRLEAMQQKVDTGNSFQITLFNRSVDDYNSRCGNFRYREGTLESVQREVDAQRERLTAEGAGRISETPPLMQSAPIESSESPSQTEQQAVPRTADGGYATAPNARGNGASEASYSAGSQVADESRATARAIDLTADEKTSLEAACSSAKYMKGTAAYDQCVSQQLAALASAPRGQDLSGLNVDELRSLEAACSSAKYLEGPASYNRCISRQLAQLASAPREQDLSGLNVDERQSLEAVCSSAKYMEGPAGYNRCLRQQLAALPSAPQGRDLSGLSVAERQSLEAACSSAKYMEGPAAYNRCVNKQLAGSAQ